MIADNPAAASHADSSASLPEVHGSIAIPRGPSFWRRLFAFAGPAYMVSVGYMDPGNWATDIEGGSRFAYQLVWVLLMSNLMAVLLQALSARLGIVSGRDLAQLCREYYGLSIGRGLWVLAEVAIAACDLAEVLGSAIALHLLFGIHLSTGVVLTVLDVLLLLAVQRLGVRKMEGLILALIATIGACYVLELVLAKPDWTLVLGGFRPRLESPAALYVAVGILGATVMPHNLYLHSALVQTRQVERTPAGMRQANGYNLIDSVVALNCAFFVNAAILILSASAFHGRPDAVTDIEEAHRLLAPLLGTSLASLAFAIGLLAAGQSSTLTGTLAGQVIMEGFVRFRMRPWLRRLVTRSMAIVPAVVTVAVLGDEGAGKLLVLSQVVLALQLPFAVIPLVQFTSDRAIMGEFANGRLLKTVAWLVALTILSLNGWLMYDTLGGWIVDPERPLWLRALVAAVVTAVMVFLATVALAPLLRKARRAKEPAAIPSTAALDADRAYRRIAVALAADSTDRVVLEHALSFAKRFDAELFLVHVAEGFGPRFFGRESDDEETRDDSRYLSEARAAAERAGVRNASRLLYGDPPSELAKLVVAEPFDLLIMGAHGHTLFGDVLFGSTVNPVRHKVRVPILIVRDER